MLARFESIVILEEYSSALVTKRSLKDIIELYSAFYTKIYTLLNSA
jgi:hypothetical protein